MTIEDIRENAVRNIAHLDTLTARLKEDIRDAQQKKAFYESEVKSYKKDREGIEAFSGVSWLRVWMEMHDLAEKDKMIIRIHENLHEYNQISELREVAHERYELIKDAKKKGVELSEESKKMLEKDLLSFLVDTKKDDIFKRDESKSFFGFTQRNKEINQRKVVSKIQQMEQE